MDRNKAMSTEVLTTSPSMVNYAKDPRLTRKIKAFLKAINSRWPAVENLPVEEARQALVQTQAFAKTDEMMLNVEC